MTSNSYSNTKLKQKPTYGWFAVYALIDPETHEVFYVGRSKNPKTRTAQHLHESKDKKPVDWFEYLWGDEVELERKKGVNERKTSRINEIMKRGQKPVVKILDEWYCEKLIDANRLEEAWVAEMILQGQPLTNGITSHRMNPAWYSPARKGWRPGWATNPREYIQELKNKNPNSARDQFVNQPVKRHNKPKAPKWDSRRLKK